MIDGRTIDHVVQLVEGALGAAQLAQGIIGFRLLSCVGRDQRIAQWLMAAIQHQFKIARPDIPDNDAVDPA